MIAFDSQPVNDWRPFLTAEALDRKKQRFPKARLSLGSCRSARREWCPVDRYGLIYPGRRLVGMKPDEMGAIPDAGEIDRVLRLLAVLPPVRIGTPTFNSYRLKHAFERAIGSYVSNGAAIVAMSRAGIIQSPIRLNSQAALSAIWVRELERLEWGAYRHV